MRVERLNQFGSLVIMVSYVEYDIKIGIHAKLRVMPGSFGLSRILWAELRVRFGVTGSLRGFQTCAERHMSARTAQNAAAGRYMAHKYHRKLGSTQ